MMASHLDPQHRTTLSACRPTAGCACRGTAITAREGGARTSGCRQHSRFDAAETGLIEVPRPKTADRNSPDAPCVIGSSGRGSGFQNLCKQRFPVREAPLDGSGSAGLFLLPKDTAARELKAGRPTEFCLRRTALGAPSVSARQWVGCIDPVTRASPFDFQRFPGTGIRGLEFHTGRLGPQEMEADSRPTATRVNAVRAFAAGRSAVEGGSLRQGIWDARVLHPERYRSLSWVEEFFFGCLECRFQSSFCLRFSGIKPHSLVA
jgi:hypothetical protein